MSDALILGLATLIAATVVTPILAFLIRRSEKKILNKVEEKTDGILTKVEEHKKEINGRVTELLETTKSLGHAEGKAEEKENNKTK